MLPRPSTVYCCCCCKAYSTTHPSVSAPHARALPQLAHKLPLTVRHTPTVTLTPPVTFEAGDTEWAPAPTSAADAAEAALQAEFGPYENYILGLLTNFGSLALERMHHLLRVFVVSEPRYEGKSPEQLAAFLGVMAAKGALTYDNGLYKKK